MPWPTQKIAQYGTRKHIWQMANNAYTAACELESICLHVEDVKRQSLHNNARHKLCHKFKNTYRKYKGLLRSKSLALQLFV